LEIVETFNCRIWSASDQKFNMLFAGFRRSGTSTVVRDQGIDQKISRILIAFVKAVQNAYYITTSIGANSGFEDLSECVEFGKKFVNIVTMFIKSISEQGLVCRAKLVKD